MGKMRTAQNSMINTIKIVLAAVAVFGLVSSQSFAADVTSLNELREQATQATQATQAATVAPTSASETKSAVGSTVPSNEKSDGYISSITKLTGGDSRNAGDSNITDISNVSRLDKVNANTKEAENTLTKIAGTFLKWLGLILSIGLGISLGIDTLYISVPFMRGILSGGKQGAMPSDMAGSGRYNMQNLGQDGINSPFNSGARQMESSNSGYSGIVKNLVSDEALSAVTAAKGGEKPMTVFIKRRLTTFIMAPVIFTLAITGVLTRLGFAIGWALTNMIDKINF